MSPEVVRSLAMRGEGRDGGRAHVRSEESRQQEGRVPSTCFMDGLSPGGTQGAEGEGGGR